MDSTFLTNGSAGPVRQHIMMIKGYFAVLLLVYLFNLSFLAIIDSRVL